MVRLLVHEIQTKSNYILSEFYVLTYSVVCTGRKKEETVRFGAWTLKKQTWIIHVTHTKKKIPETMGVCGGNTPWTLHKKDITQSIGDGTTVYSRK